MLNEKNRVMMFIALGILILMAVVHASHGFGFSMESGYMHGMTDEGNMDVLNNAVVVLPVFFFWLPFHAYACKTEGRLPCCSSCP